MKKRNSVLPILLITVVIGSAFAQCPTDAADFANGGNFSGPCTLVLGGGSVTISSPNVVNWLGDVLNINGTPGSLTVANGATFNILAGSVSANDATSGSLTVNGTMSIASGATYNSWLTIQVSGSLMVSGSLQADNSRMMIHAGASVTIDGGTITAVGTGNCEVTGALAISNGGNLVTNGDLEVSGSVNVDNTSQMNIGDDLSVFNGGSVIIDGTANIDNDVSNVSDDFGPNGGTFVINGTLNVGSTVNILDTNAPESSLLGTGQITAQDSFTDGECSAYADGLYAFCDCTGDGATCNGALPIILTHFSAIQKGNAIYLRWKTSSEMNNHFFTIERLTSTDKFQPLLNIDGNGTTFVSHQYQAFDSSPVSGKNYYRLKQTDFDGTTTTSSVIMAEFLGGEIHATIYPNPTHDGKFVISISGLTPGQEIHVSLTTVQGVRIASRSEKADRSGDVSAELEVPAKGIYLLHAGGRSIKIIME